MGKIPDGRGSLTQDLLPDPLYPSPGLGRRRFLTRPIVPLQDLDDDCAPESFLLVFDPGSLGGHSRRGPWDQTLFPFTGVGG